MEQTPKRRLIIRKKPVAKEELDESLLPPTTVPLSITKLHSSNCTFYPVTESTKKKCPCGGEYTSDSEYTPRECCSGLYTSDRRYIWIEGRYTPDYIPVDDERKMAKEKFYSGFCKPLVYDFNNDTDIVTTKEETKTKRGFTIMSASQLRENQRDSRDTSRDYREDKRDSREDWRNTSRDYREDKRGSREDWRNTSRDYREDKRDSRDTSRDYREDKRDWRNTSRDSRNDRDYHRTRERDYVRTTRVKDEPNSYNGGRREPSKSKFGLDSELCKYGRKF